MASKYTFSDECRITNTKDFQRIRKSSIRARSGGISLSFLPRTGTKRIGVITPRHMGNAVMRNRFRRTVREFFRCNRSIFPDGDCVVIAVSNMGLSDIERIPQMIIDALSCIKEGI